MKPALAIALIGPGHVGRTFLAQLHAALPRLARDGARPLALRAVCNSRRMALGEPALDASLWRGALEGGGEPRDFARLTRHLARHEGPVAVVDTTASAEVAGRHADWLRRGFAVVTANKLAGAAPLPRYEELTAAARASGAAYLCETTVGAGLPVLGTLRDFVRTGDEVLAIEGVLSGTLSHLTAALGRGERFSETVRRLHAEGYTEPDPRADLGGADVARKLVILARTAGIPLGAEEVGVEGLLRGGEDDRSVAAFLGNCARYDAEIAARFAEAAAEGRALCFVAQLRAGARPEARVGLASYPRDHPLARVTPGDNLVRVSTRRYRANPLVIQGPGAGPEVTAAGVFADLLRLA